MLRAQRPPLIAQGLLMQHDGLVRAAGLLAGRFLAGPAGQRVRLIQPQLEPGHPFADDPVRVLLTGEGSDLSLTVAATDLVMDRLPPIAELSLGVQYMPTPKLAIRASAYNALFGHAYQPDVFADYEPHLEYLPNPYEGFRAYLSATYQY